MGLPKRMYRSASLFSRGSSYDVQHPDADHDPTANQLNYQDIDATTQKTGNIFAVAFDGLASMFGLTGILDIIDGTADGTFDPGAAVGNFFNTLIRPLADFGAALMEPIRDVVDGIVAFLGPIPIVGTAVQNLANFLGLTHVNADVAQTSANTANVGLAILTQRVNEIVTGGASYYDTFGRDLSDFSTDPDYDVVVSGGSGSPFLTTANDGRLRWNAVGFSDTRFIARRKTVPMTTNRVRVSVVIDDFTYGFAGNQAHIWLMARMDDTEQNYVIGVVEDGLAEIGYVVSGIYTRLGGQESVSTSTGDLWDLEISVGTDEWRFRLLQNNNPRVDRTDLGHVSMKDTTPGTTYKWTAIGGDCAIGAGPFGSTYQIGMPDFQVIAAGDF